LHSYIQLALFQAKFALDAHEHLPPANLSKLIESPVFQKVTINAGALQFPVTNVCEVLIWRFGAFILILTLGQYPKVGEAARFNKLVSSASEFTRGWRHLHAILLGADGPKERFDARRHLHSDTPAKTIASPRSRPVSDPRPARTCRLAHAGARAA
jgi:hypothetical protein